MSTPITRSRGAPYLKRLGPLSLVASRPPIVERSRGSGSSGSHCRSRPRTALTLASRAPPAVAVKSPAQCSIGVVSRDSDRHDIDPGRDGPSAAWSRPTRHDRELFLVGPAEHRGQGRHVMRCENHGRVRLKTASAGPGSRAAAPQRETATSASPVTVHVDIRSAQRYRRVRADARDRDREPRRRARRRKEFARIADAARIEGTTDALHGVEIICGEHLGHIRLLVDTDAVLAGQ